jgi:hypothetical protein
MKAMSPVEGRTWRREREGLVCEFSFGVVFVWLKACGGAWLGAEFLGTFHEAEEAHGAFEAALGRLREGLA